jgi:hypothetical protein
MLTKRVWLTKSGDYTQNPCQSHRCGLSPHTAHSSSCGDRSEPSISILEPYMAKPTPCCTLEAGTLRSRNLTSFEETKGRACAAPCQLVPR